MTIRTTSHPCDARCMGATGPDCSCSCGGRNHGKWNGMSFGLFDAPAPTKAEGFALEPLAEGEPVLYAGPLEVPRVPEIRPVSVSAGPRGRDEHGAQIDWLNPQMMLP